MAPGSAYSRSDIRAVAEGGFMLANAALHRIGKSGSRVGAPGVPARCEPLTFRDIERLVRRLAASQPCGSAVELRSITEASDGSCVTLDCSAAEAGRGGSLEDVGSVIAAALDPELLGALPEAKVRVAFV